MDKLCHCTKRKECVVSIPTTINECWTYLIYISLSSSSPLRESNFYNAPINFRLVDTIRSPSIFKYYYSGYRLTRRHSLPMKIVPLINESRYDIQSDEGKSYIFADTPPRSPSGTRLCTSCTSAGSPPTATSSESASPRRRRTRTRTRGASPTSSWISPHSDSTETSSPSEKGESASV